MNPAMVFLIIGIILTCLAFLWPRVAPAFVQNLASRSTESYEHVPIRDNLFNASLVGKVVTWHPRPGEVFIPMIVEDWRITLNKKEYKLKPLGGNIIDYVSFHRAPDIDYSKVYISHGSIWVPAWDCQTRSA